jgi:antigen flippase
MRPVVSSFLATVGVQVATVIGGVLTARLLGPTGKGEYAAIVLWPSLLASTGSLGIVEATGFITAKSRENTDAVLPSALALALIISCILIGAGVLFVPHLIHNRDLSATALAYLAFIPLNLVSLIIMQSMLGAGEVGIYSFLRAFVYFVFLAGILLALSVGIVSVTAFAVISLASNCATLITALSYSVRRNLLKGLPETGKIVALVQYGWRAHLASLASLANARLDQALLAIFLPAAALGYYTVAVTFSIAVQLSATTMIPPAFSAIARSDNLLERRRVWGQYVRFSAYVAICLGSLLLTSATVLVRAVFGAAYLPSVTPARILIAAGVPLTLSLLLGCGYRAIGKPLVPSQAEGVGLLVTGGALALLMPVYGTTGAASATLLGCSSSCAILILSLSHQAGIRPTDMLIPSRSDSEYARRELRIWMGRVRELSIQFNSKRNRSGLRL